MWKSRRVTELHLIIVGINSALFQKFFVSSPFGDPVFCDYQNLIRIADGGKPVGDGDGGSIFRQLFQTLLDPALAFVIERAGGFVQDEDCRIPKEDSCDRKKLSLPDGNIFRIITQNSLIAVRQSADKEVCTRRFCGGNDRFMRCAGPAVCDILFDGSFKKPGVLEDHTEAVSQIRPR